MNNPSHFELRDLEKAINADVRKKAAKNGGAPPWLKDYTGQLYDPEYSRLTLAERGLLKDLRLLALARDNKIPNDEQYLREQLRCSSRTRLAPKLHTLRAKGFLLPHPDAHELPAKQVSTSRENLDAGESQVTTDKRREEKEQENGSSTSWPSAVGDIPRIGASGVLDELARRRAG